MIINSFCTESTRQLHNWA